MKLYFEINDVEYCVEFDYKITAEACPETGPSYASGGEPASGMEWEVDGDLTLFLATKPEESLEIPDWLNKQLMDQIYEDESGKIYDQIEQDAGEDYYDDRD